MKNREASIMHKVGNDQWGEGEGRPYKGGSIWIELWRMGSNNI